MKKTTFLAFLSLIACHFDRKCEDSLTLNSDVFINGWSKNDLTITKVVVYEYEVSNKESELNPYSIKNFIPTYSARDNGEIRIRTSGLFKTNNNYELVLNDSLRFYISDFEIDNIERGTAVTVQKYCVVLKYKVNGTDVNFDSNHLYFDKSLASRR